jgi:type III secretion protein C
MMEVHAVEALNRDAHGVPTKNVRDGTAAQRTFVANEQGVEQVFKALSTEIGKPLILSTKARRYRVSGEFDLSDPFAILSRVSSDLGLIWYYDGQVVYVYDASETASNVVSLEHVSLKVLIQQLRSSALYDERFPLRDAGGSGSFYVSGPPKYIELVSLIAAQLETVSQGREEQAQEQTQRQEVIEAIKLKHAFVVDRSFNQRGEKVDSPGMASIIQMLLSDEGIATRIRVQEAPEPKIESLSDDHELEPDSSRPALASPTESETMAPGAVRVIAYRNTNSLVVRGPAERVRLVKNLVAALDVPSKQLELSLWIIDVAKSDLDEIGVDWNGKVATGSGLDVRLNRYEAAMGSNQTQHFLAEISALNRSGKAHVVARPLLLVQENSEALFDNNRSFYVQMIGERVAEFQTVTYGTSISVLPRVSDDDQHIEIVLDIEDGGTVAGASGSVSGLPVVSRTQLSTVARVARAQSLLIGGYTREEIEQDQRRVPLLGDLPWVGGLFRFDKQRQSQQVRMFLIQPRLLLADGSQALAKQSLTPDPSANNAVDLLKNYLEQRHGLQR